MNEQKRVEKPSLRLNITRLSIADENLGKQSRLTWSIRAGYPRIVVFLGDNKANSVYENMLIIPFTHQAIIGLFSAIEEVADDKTGSMDFTINCENIEWRDGVKTENKIVAGSVTIKRDEKGVVSLFLKAKDRPDVRFRLLLDKDWFKVYQNGSEITSHKRLSEIYAKGYAKTLSLVMSDLIAQYTIDNDAVSLDK